MSSTPIAIRLTLAAAVLAAPASAQTQTVTGPKAVYWMTAETSSGLPGAGGPGFNPMAMLSGGQTSRTLDLRLQADGATASPSAEHVIPAGLRMGASLPLLSPNGRSAQDERVDPADIRELVNQGSGRNARMLVYFGCGDDVASGQPLTYRMTPDELRRLGALSEELRLSRVEPPAAGAGRTFGSWPNERNRRDVPANGSLIGDHVIGGNYTPEIRFNLSAGQDFLAPLQLTLGEGSNRLGWNAIAGAAGYFASALGSNEAGDLIVWSSSDSGVGPRQLPDMLPPADVSRLITQKVILPPSTTECRIPRAVLEQAPEAMIKVVAYGGEVNVAFPERPADRRQPWNIEYTVKVRYNSTATTFAGMDMSDQANSDEQGQRPPRTLPGSGDAVGGAIVRGLGGLFGRR